MTDSGLRQAFKELTCNLMRVLFAYALVLQALAPLAVARAEAREGLSGHAMLCSAMADPGSERHGKAPVRVVHDCLSYCLGSAVAVLSETSARPEPPGLLPLLVASGGPEAVVLTARAGGPPPQRAPPCLA